MARWVYNTSTVHIVRLTADFFSDTRLSGQSLAVQWQPDIEQWKESEARSRNKTKKINCHHWLITDKHAKTHLEIYSSLFTIESIGRIKKIKNTKHRQTHILTISQLKINKQNWTLECCDSLNIPMFNFIFLRTSLFISETGWCISNCETISLK